MKLYFKTTLLFFLFPVILFSQPDKQAARGRAQTGSVRKVSGEPFNQVLNASNITVWTRAEGWHPNHHLGFSAGTYPKGTISWAWAGGWLFGGRVNDGNTSQVIRVGGNLDRPGMHAGRILGTPGNVTGREDPQAPDVRIWKVRPDWETADLADDAAHFFDIALSQVTDAEIQAVRDQYEADWNGWPANNKGAPYNDVDGDGMYDPAVDVPGISGASQTVWQVSNDLESSRSLGFYGSNPTGIEFQLTAWAYASTTPINESVFYRAKYIYKGTESTPMGSTIDSMYVVKWCDACLGNWTDDFVAVDTTLDLGYAWNSTTLDRDYLGVGLTTPAFGWDFLNGVAQFTGNPNDSAIVDLKWRKGYRYVLQDAQGNPTPLTGFFRGAAGAIDPPYPNGEYSRTIRWYKAMRGFLPLDGPDEPVIDPTTGLRTRFTVAGDPVTGTGWIDGSDFPPGDRRVTLIHGPFGMALGDTAEIVVAMVAGTGADAKSSITVMKFNDTFTQFAFDNLFVLPEPPPAPTVTVGELDREIVLSWGQADLAREIEDVERSGFRFEGYNVYQFPSATSSLSDAVKIATFDEINEVTVILGRAIDPVTGVVIEQPSQVGTNAGVERFISIERDAITGFPVINGRDYFFAVTAYSFTEDISSPFRALESSPVLRTARPQTSKPGERYGAASGDTLFAGGTDTTVMAFGIIIDPSKTTGATYSISLDTLPGGIPNWSLTVGDQNITGQSNLSGDGKYPVVDGILVKVVGSPIPMSFSFTAPSTRESDALAKADVNLINVFPNPYYGFNLWEETRLGKFVTFSHLPRRAIIRIYTLGAMLIRTLNKDDSEQFMRWNLRNENNLPVASGVYIVHINLPNVGETKIMKLMVVMEEQFLRIY